MKNNIVCYSIQYIYISSRNPLNFGFRFFYFRQYKTILKGEEPFPKQDPYFAVGFQEQLPVKNKIVTYQFSV